MSDRPYLIDAHAHINFQAYKDDAPEVIARAESERIWMIAVGSQIDTSRRAIAYAERYPHIWAAVGLHPIHLVDALVDEQEVDTAEHIARGVSGVVAPGPSPRIQFRTRQEIFDVDVYRELAAHPKVVAIGECGLDRYRVPLGEDPDEVFRRQEEVFRQQIVLAQAVDLPLIVHVRDAHEDTIRILEATRSGWHRESSFGLIHCYTGTWDQAQRYLALGFNISFTGIITFRPTPKQMVIAEELWRTVRGVPLDRLHVETDCPYLAPEPHRGERNEPRYVRHVAERVAALRGIALEQIAMASVENALRLFRKMAHP
ncbi:TatD family hydrolase [Candidatus Uhrbacteria bacterium]|nr:TatD family hydrolase [Candidatus Uhrbacteria bacterium]